jgi:predicted nicotinamide N-methyase
MPGYQTKQECIAIAGVHDLIIRSLLDRQQYFDPDGDADRIGISSAAWPLFGLLWPSGAHLAARLALRPISNECILEIGCGLALASLVGHRRGANITASDCHPLAAGFLLENLRLNHLPPLKYLHGHWNAPELPASSAIAVMPSPPTVQGLYDLIIGSDLLYERDDNAGLASFIERHAGPCAEVWIVDPNRGNRPAFNRHMAQAGFRMREEKLDTQASIGIPAYKGRLLIYQRLETDRPI